MSDLEKELFLTAPKGSLIKLLLRAAVVFICSVIIAVGLMWMIRAIPFNNAYKHIYQEAQTLAHEPTYPQVLGKHITIYALRRDNATDACMLSTMMPDPSRTAFQSALIDAHTSVSALAKAPSQKEAERLVKTGQYARYWHGYQLLYLPLLEMTSYNGARITLAVILVLELLVILALLVKRIGWQVALLFGLSVLAIYGFVIPFSFQFIAVFLISFAFSIVVLTKKRLSSYSLVLLLFFSGILTVFFDFLTAPFIACGLPLLCYLALRFHQSPADFGGKRTYVQILSGSAAWLVGYGLFWVAKWILASAFLPINIMNDAMGAVTTRAGVGHTGNLHLVISALVKVCTVLIPWQVSSSVLGRSLIFVAVVLALFLVWLALYLRKHRRGKGAKNELPFLLVAILPFVWLLGMAEHTSIHYWFSYRVVIVSIFATLLFAYYSLKSLRINEVTDWDENDSELSRRVVSAEGGNTCRAFYVAH